MKNLYLVERTDEVGYDEYDSFVVCAESEEQARSTHPDINNNNDCTWINNADSTYISCTYIGVASDHVELNEVIISSFNAG